MSNELKFIKLVLNENKPVYNENNNKEILCEVLMDGIQEWAYVEIGNLRSNGVLIPGTEPQENEVNTKIKKKSLFDNLDFSDNEIEENVGQITSNDDHNDFITEVDREENVGQITSHDDHNDFTSEVDRGFIWSTYRSTPRDIEATEKFIDIVTTEPYEQKLKDKRTPKYKVWQEISTELQKLGYIVADNEIEGGKKCDQKWRNLENKYISFNDNANKTGESSKKKPMFYDIMHAIKDKHKVSPPTLLDTLKTSTLKTPLNVNTLESTPSTQNSETVVSSITRNMHNIPKTSLKPKTKVSPSDILDHMTKHHKEVLDMQEKHFEEMKANMTTQNNQRQEMLSIFAKLVENTTKKKRRRSDSD